MYLFASLGGAEPCVLLVEGLERTVPELGAGVDELELDLLEVPTRGVDHQALAEGDDTLLGSGNRSLEDEEIVLDDTVMGEATHGCDGLLGDIGLSRSAGLIAGGTNAVDLLVELGTVMVTIFRNT